MRHLAGAQAYFGMTSFLSQTANKRQTTSSSMNVSASFSAQKRTPDTASLSTKPMVTELDLGSARKPKVHTLYFAGAHRKIMTYNAENFLESRRGAWIKPKGSVQALADVILHEKPDVIALQEVGSKQLLAAFNKKHLNSEYPHIVQFPPQGSGRGIQVAILGHRDLKLVSAQSHWNTLAKGSNNPAATRDLLEATFETPTGYQFTVYTGHFRSMRRGEKETMKVRIHEATQTASVIQQRLQKNPNEHIVMTGDLNTKYDSPYGKPVLDTLSLRLDADPGNDLTETMLKDGKGEATHGGGEGHPPTKLDYMFVSRAMLPQVRSAYVSGDFRQNPWRLASDHRPLVTIVEEPELGHLIALPGKQRQAYSPNLPSPPRHSLDLAA